MTSEVIEPFEYLIQSFSKHKFKLLFQRLVFEPTQQSLADHYIERWAQPMAMSAHREHWPAHNFGWYDVHLFNWNTGPGFAFRHVYIVDHVQDGFLPLGWDTEIVSRRAKICCDNIHAKFRSVFNGSYLTFYYVTNLLPPNRDVDFSETLGLGLGTPKSFLHGPRRDFVMGQVSALERHPDSLQLQFADGNICVASVNERNAGRFGPNLALSLNQVIPSVSTICDAQAKEFEHLLNKSERHLQSFLEKNAHILFGDEYVELRPQVILSDEDGRELRPDFFLRPVNFSTWDVLELKLPTVRLLKGPAGREDLTAQVRKGVQQLRDYARYFDNPRNRDRILRQTGIDCFKPKLILLIGRRSGIHEDLWRRVLSEDPGLPAIWTFDDLIARFRKTSTQIQSIIQSMPTATPVCEQSLLASDVVSIEADWYRELSSR